MPPHICNGTNSVLRLSREVNSHVQKKEMDTYPLEICQGGLSCDYAQDCSGLGSNYKCMASISDDTKAVLGDCNAYLEKICCTSEEGEGGTENPIIRIIRNLFKLFTG